MDGCRLWCTSCTAASLLGALVLFASPTRSAPTCPSPARLPCLRPTPRRPRRRSPALGRSATQRLRRHRVMGRACGAWRSSSRCGGCLPTVHCNGARQPLSSIVVRQQGMLVAGNARDPVQLCAPHSCASVPDPNAFLCCRCRRMPSSGWTGCGSRTHRPLWWTQSCRCAALLCGCVLS